MSASGGTPVGLVLLDGCFAARRRRIYVRAVGLPAPMPRDQIRDVNVRYHDLAAADYDAKWGIDYGDDGPGQVVGKLAQGARRASRERYGRALEIGAGHRLLHAQPAARRA